MFITADGIALILIVTPIAMFLERCFSYKLPNQYGRNASIFGLLLGTLFFVDRGYSFANDWVDLLVFLTIISLISSGFSAYLGRLKTQYWIRTVIRIFFTVTLFLIGLFTIPIETSLCLGIERADRKFNKEGGVSIRAKGLPSGLMDFYTFFIITKRIGLFNLFEKRVGTSSSDMPIYSPDNLKIDLDTLHRKILIEYGFTSTLIQKDSIYY